MYGNPEQARLAQQLIAELDEAEGQLRTARGILQNLENQAHYRDGQILDSQQRWLVWHKCQEAETNLHNVAAALEKGARE